MGAAHEWEASDHVYGKVGNTDLQGTLFQPRNAAPCPLVLEVHGGAWTANDRHRNSPIHHFLAASGIAVFAIDFRMPPTASYPAALFDIHRAIAWLKDNAERFGSRRECVGGVGTSSGGHLLMLAAMRALSGRYREASQPAADARLPYVIACWPVLDPLARYAYARTNKLQRLIDAHHAFWRDEAEMEEANPLRILQRGEAVDLPPVLLLQGTADANFDYRNTVDFAQAYRRAGGQAELELFEGAPHAFIKEGQDSTASQSALRRMRDFILAHCHDASA